MIFVCVLVLFLCASVLPSSAKVKQKNLAPTINKLALEMLKDGDISPRGENVLLCPYSFVSPMAALYIGSAEDTKQEFENAFNFNDKTKHEFIEMKRSLDAIAAEKGWIDVSRVFANQNEKKNLLYSFVDFLKKFLRTDVAFLDFSKGEFAANEINSWASDATEQMINGIIQKEDLTPTTGMVLVNAVHFRVPWQDKFLAKNTQELSFYTEAEENEKKEQKTQFLTKKFNALNFYEDKTLSAISIPYEWSRMSFIVILPKEGQKLADFLPSLTMQQLGKIRSGLKEVQVEVALPRLRTEYKSDLTDFTTALIPRATNRVLANFSKITGRRDYYIGKVIQKTAINLTEDGTEAGSATAVHMLTMSAPSRVTKKFFANRPFIYLIYDSETNTILFIGKYEKAE